MNKFETMDNMNTDFVTLSNQELMDMDGGSLTVGFALGTGAVALAVAVGTIVYKMKR